MAQPRFAQPSGDPNECFNGFVYIIERDGDHRIKIGSSIDPQQRVRQLQTGSADRLTIVYTHRVQGSARAVEVAAHDILDRCRGLGEWFDAPTEIAVGVINTAAWRLASEVPAYVGRRMSGDAKAKLVFTILALAAFTFLMLWKPN